MKLLVLSASTGAGHDMRAFALRDWLVDQGGQCEVYHPLENTFGGYKLGCHLYNLIQKKLPLLHFFYFHFLEYASLHRHPRLIIGAKKFKQKLEDFAPHLIVSMHAHLNHGYFELSQTLNFNLPRFVVYCGELADGVGFSQNWVNPKNHLFISPYQEGCLAAQRRGMPSARTLAGGPLLRKPFFNSDQQINRKNVMTAMGLDPNLPVGLLGTGANGVNQHISVIRTFNEAKIRVQLLALCGDNKKTLSQIKEISQNFDTKVFPFSKVDAVTMQKFLCISNWMFARPGAGLTTEAIVSGCPMIFDLSRGCMPQETNTLNFWKLRAGNLLTVGRPAALAKTINSGCPIPRLEIPLDPSPAKILGALSNLVR